MLVPSSAQGLVKLHVILQLENHACEGLSSAAK